MHSFCAYKLRLQDKFAGESSEELAERSGAKEPKFPHDAASVGVSKAHPETAKYSFIFSFIAAPA